MRKLFVGVMGLSMLLLLGVASAPAALAKSNHVKASKVKTHDPVIYDSLVTPNPGNLASESFEASATAEFGNQITFGGTARVLDNVVVQLSSWGCEQGGWSTPSAQAAYPPAPASGTIVQQAPGGGSTNAGGWGTFTDQLNTNDSNAVTFLTTSPNASLNVSSSGQVTTVGSFPSNGAYTVSGTDSDTNSGTGVWSYTMDIGANPCLTTPGATFSEPITLNIYNVGPASAYGPSTVGNLVASDTQTFAIPYRPSEDDTDCTGNKAGAWYDADLATCFHGLLTPIQFNFGHVIIPDDVIYGIIYNTSDWGPQPYTHSTPCGTATDSYITPNTYDGCGYDSLNVALSQEPTAPSPGSDPYQGTIYENVVNQSYAVNDYCDAGAAGINVFRIDEPANYPTGNGTTSGCWSVNANNGAPWYIPAVQFNAVNNTAPSITSLAAGSVVAGTPFSFQITTTGVPTPTITVAHLPKGLSVTQNGGGTATISGTASTKDRNATYVVVVRARNAHRNSVAKQRLMLTLTGGRG